MPSGQIVITLSTWHCTSVNILFSCLEVHIHVKEPEVYGYVRSLLMDRCICREMFFSMSPVWDITSEAFPFNVPVRCWHDFTGQIWAQWWRDLFRCIIDILNFSVGFNIIAPHMEFPHLKWYIAEWAVHLCALKFCLSHFTLLYLRFMDQSLIQVISQTGILRLWSTCK